MALRIHPRLWQQALLAAAGVMPFTACGGATELNDGDSDSDNGGSAGKASGGARNIAGKGGRASAGRGQGGSINIAGTGGTATAGTGSVVSGGSGPVNHFPCINPTPYPFPGTGYEVCQGGFLHRKGPAACPAGGACTTDAGCASGQLCVCHDGRYGVCEVAGCDADADCRSGFLCIGMGPGDQCGFGSGFSCQTPADTCAGSQQCDDCSGCVPSPVGRECQPCCAVGRPFLVDGQARSAEATGRADWLCAELKPELGLLSVEQRRALAHSWQECALMEHASIASFARFVLDLMSLGAPAALVESATQAMLDESAHAKLCFALASSYAGRALGPTGLSIVGSLDQRTLQEIVVSTVLEGCIGETVAALEAAEALEHATDPAVRLALSQIARDELGHAALAYRFVRWAVETFGGELERAVTQAYREALSAASPMTLVHEVDAGLLAHGVLSNSHKAELRHRVLGELVAPILPSLLAA